MAGQIAAIGEYHAPFDIGDTPPQFAVREIGEALAAMHEATDSCNANLIFIGRLIAAVVPVLPDAHRGVEARPRGGSKTKARRRLADLTALVTPDAEEVS